MYGGRSHSTTAWPLTLLARKNALSPADVVLMSAGVVAIALGVAFSAGWGSHVGGLSQADLHASLSVTGGALLFGAGLLHMSMWRLGDDAARAYAGAALVVLGLLTTLTSRTGHLLHDDGVAAALNPLTLAWAGLASLGLGCAAFTSGARGQSPQLVRPSTVAAVLVVTTLAGLTLLGEARRQIGFDVALSAATHVQVELLVAVVWVAGALVARHRLSHGHHVPGLTPGVLGTLALVWVLRAVAVTDLHAWGVVGAGLLATTALVVLSTATSDFVDATEAEHTRADEAERAVLSAAHQLQRHDDESRSLNHEARNMLLALRTASQTLAMHGDRLDAEVRHELEEAIASEAVRLDELIAARARRARARQPALVPAQRGPMLLESAG